MKSIVFKSDKSTPRLEQPDRNAVVPGAGTGAGPASLAGAGTVTGIDQARSLRRARNAREAGRAWRARQAAGTGVAESVGGAGWMVHGYRVRFTDPSPCVPRAGRRRASRVRAYVQRSSVSASLNVLVRQWLELRGEGGDTGTNAGAGLHHAPGVHGVRGVRGGVV